MAKNRHWRSDPSVRLTDPRLQASLDKKLETLKSDKALGLRFLQEMGLLTLSGRLARQYR